MERSNCHVPCLLRQIHGKNGTPRFLALASLEGLQVAVDGVLLGTCIFHSVLFFSDFSDSSTKQNVLFCWTLVAEEMGYDFKKSNQNWSGNDAFWLEIVAVWSGNVALVKFNQVCENNQTPSKPHKCC